MIEEFKDKKVVDYLNELKDGKKVLIRFGHGWGDLQMFLPLYGYLICNYPKTNFDLYVECGQEEIINSYPEKDSKEHDLVFSLNFPMSEGTDLTKSEKCCVDELGIQPMNGVLPLPQKHSPFVACHFQGTALPNSVNCPEGVSQQIWYEIIEAKKIPIECHFEHCFHNPVNSKYGFIWNTVRGTDSNLNNLIGLIQHSFAFIGVASGPFITSLSIMPNKTLFLERNHKLESYTKRTITKIDVMNYQSGTVREWIKSLS